MKSRMNARVRRTVQTAEAIELKLEDEDIVEFFSSRPTVTDDEVHAFAESNGMTPEVVEGRIYQLFHQMIHEAAEGEEEGEDEGARAEASSLREMRKLMR